MFLTFFYALRGAGLKVSLHEWLTLMAGLQAGLHQSTLSGFYGLCRTVLVKDETKYDLFDCAFLRVFQGGEDGRRLPPELLRWLEHPAFTARDFTALAAGAGMTPDEIQTLFQRRLREQTEEHNGGNRWIGTSGFTPFGNHGRKLGGIRVGGKSEYRSAYQVAGQRKYRDWRTDAALEPRQFQMAFRTLRQYSKNEELPKTALDVDRTIRKTCDRGGILQIEYDRPRQNLVKVMLLMDSGGSMEEYSLLCSALFQAVSRDNHFKDLKIYYFHNCIYSNLYTSPVMDYRHVVQTDWVLQNIPRDYRVILVGDGEMDMEELLAKGPPIGGKASRSGFDRLMQLRERYEHLIWLHPQAAPSASSYWTESFEFLQRHFPMYRLSVEGLQQGMRKLMDMHRC